MASRTANTTVGIVLAAGNARRMGENKMLMRIGGKSVLGRSLAAFTQASCCDRIIIVCRNEDTAAFAAIADAELTMPYRLIEGGTERQHSVENALLTASDANVVVVHDGARCFIEPDIIKACAEAARTCCAAAAGVRTKDTIKQIDGDMIAGTLDRTHLVNIQTPQAFLYSLLINAHQKAKEDGFIGTDECSLLERLDIPIRFIDAHYDNIKVTTKEDIRHGRHIVGETLRAGTGFDAHRLKAGLPLILGGVSIPHTHGLLGHSDADVLLHAVMDAMLGAAALGDIGQHFPSNNDAYRGISSMTLLGCTKDIVQNAGFSVVNIDATVVMQRPKIAPYINEMRKNIAEALDISIDAVSVKATTTEGLGFEGRSEGVSAMAAAMLTG